MKNYAMTAAEEQRDSLSRVGREPQNPDVRGMTSALTRCVVGCVATNRNDLFDGFEWPTYPCPGPLLMQKRTLVRHGPRVRSDMLHKNECTENNRARLAKQIN